jgi:DNA-binding beta-propeller fold protein YncE
MPTLRSLAPAAAAAALLAAGCSNVDFPKNGQWPARPVPAYASQARFAVTDNMSDTLSFVSPSVTTPALFGSEPVGDNPVELEGPHHIAASPDGKYLYVNLSNVVPGSGSGPHGSHGTGTVPGSLLKLDARSGQELGETPVDRSPGDVILSSDGKTAYVTHYDLLRLTTQISTMPDQPEAGFSDLAIIDTDTMVRLSMIPVCPTAHGEGLSADGKTLYTVCALSDELAVIDVSNPRAPTVTKKLYVGPSPGVPGNPNYAPYALAVSPTTGLVWISDNKGDLRIYNPVAGAMDDAHAILLGDVVMFGAFTKDGSTLYVARQGDGDWVSRIDTATFTPRGVALPLPESACLNAHAVQLAPDEQTLIVVCEGDHVKIPGSIAYVDTQAFALHLGVQVGMFADGAAYLPPAP